MYSFDLQMSEIHVLLAWCSVALFLVRGLAFQFGGQWALDSRLSVLVFGIDALMTITGLSLWALLFLNPFLRDSWLLAKLIALVVYTVCAHWAMGRGEFRSLGYLLALLSLAYMLACSITRSPWLGL
ncbi:SirB2 family protein [Paucibacter sp. DJ2R-2]|uniref:SirB2 family protein n=1 Tax=Paucibacter sp. DJ2R-2 TaxID=2893558 RepID=UPI0021E422B7|nr:SirB2 family protein [Paucibacter sp. DJ2R-2]MCV2418989.1 SirB2 family protein [Paucibacter sp. DJ4R-1]MCV2438056.1 SirB2 family protein [Paucibacter sp. DJ2R-2]